MKPCILVLAFCASTFALAQESEKSESQLAPT